MIQILFLFSFIALAVFWFSFC